MPTRHEGALMLSAIRRAGAVLGGRVGTAFDVGSDWAVASFAVWTLIAYAGMVTGAAATLLVTVWLVTVPLTGAALAVARRRYGPPQDHVAAPRHDAAPSYSWLAAA